MDAKLESLNRALKSYDRYLYAERSSDNELIGVYRKSVRWDTYDWYGDKLSVLRPSPDPVMFLTTTWNIHGFPVDWGIEPVMAKLREYDCWNHDNLEEVIASNQTLKQNKDRSFRNELKAVAADCRRDFAKAVNDINTSTIEMVDSRRKKDGNCK